MEHKNKADAQKKFIEALSALTLTKQIDWYQNGFGDRCADITVSLIETAGVLPMLRFLSAVPEKRPRVFQSSEESLKTLSNNIKGEILAQVSIRAPRSPLGGR